MDDQGRRKPKFAAGSDTSEEAAESMAEHAPGLEAKVLAAIVVFGMAGATTDELEAALKMTHQTCSARVNGLAERGAIADSGERRKTRSGRRATVYVAAEYLTEEMREAAARLAEQKRQAREDRAAKRLASRARLVALDLEKERYREDLGMLYDAARKMSEAWNNSSSSPSDIDRADRVLRAQLDALKGRF